MGKRWNDSGSTGPKLPSFWTSSSSEPKTQGLEMPKNWLALWPLLLKDLEHNCSVLEKELGKMV